MHSGASRGRCQRNSRGAVQTGLARSAVCRGTNGWCVLSSQARCVSSTPVGELSRTGASRADRDVERERCVADMNWVQCRLQKSLRLGAD